MKHLPGEEVYDRLLDELRAAVKELEGHPHSAGVTALLAVMDYFTAIYVPASLQKPLERAAITLADANAISEHGKKPGPKPRPWIKAKNWSMAAAVITALRRCGRTVDYAIRRVSAETCIDPRRLRSLRDNIHRGRADKFCIALYQSQVENFEKLPEEDLERKLLTHLHDNWLQG